VDRGTFRAIGVTICAVVTVLSAVLMSTPALAATGDTEIESRWQALGAGAGPLGAKLAAPDDDPYDVSGGRAEDFANGSIFWSDGTGAWEVLGAARTYYTATQGPAGPLGFPTAAPEALASGAATRQVFAGGHVYSSTETGTHGVTGPVVAKFLALGGVTQLGLPTAEESPVPGGTQTVFQSGRLYRSGTSVYALMTGPLLDRYLALGGPAGKLRLPTSDETPVPGARRVSFQGGAVFWTQTYGARVVEGSILTRYLQIGGTASYVGVPTTDMYVIAGGRRSRFQYGYITAYGTAVPIVTGGWRFSTQAVTAAEIPYTYRSGCPVGPASLRRVKMPYYDWNGVPKIGDLIIRTTAVADMQRVFYGAFAARFNVRQIRPVDVYKGSDIASMAADNTSAFNCRKVTGNPYRLSQHSYGNAIDINTYENPYVTGSTVYPAGSRTYLNRSVVRKGMIVKSGVIAYRMAVYGWPWGARWSHPDYQHFSSNGG
jgi:hypothetical protein